MCLRIPKQFQFSAPCAESDYCYCGYAVLTCHFVYAEWPVCIKWQSVMSGGTSAPFGDPIRHQRLYDPSGSSSGGAHNTDYTTEDTATTVTNGSTCRPVNSSNKVTGKTIYRFDSIIGICKFLSLSLGSMYCLSVIFENNTFNFQVTKQ